MGNNRSRLTELITNQHNAAATQDKVKAAFDAYDKDHSMFLDKKEFTSFGSDLLNIVADITDISKVDILAGKNPEQWFSDEFDTMDQNKDGRISFMEFNDYIWNTYSITFATGATTSKYHGVANAPKHH